MDVKVYTAVEVAVHARNSTLIRQMVGIAQRRPGRKVVLGQ